MKKLLLGVVALWLAFASPAFATNLNIDGLPAATSVTGTSNLFECEQSGTNNQCTSVQIAAYIYGLMNGDCTSSGVGAIVCLKTNGTAFGALATVAPGTGVATLLGGASSGTGGPAGTTSPTFTTPALGTPSAAVLTNATGLPIGTGVSGLGTGVATLLGGTSSGTGGPAGTASPTFTGTPTAPTATVGTNTTQLATTAFVLANAGSGAVSSVTGGIGTTCSPTTGSVVCSAPATARNTTATTDTITSSDKGTIVTESNAASIAVAITTTGFVNTDYFTVKNLSTLAGVATYTPSSGTIDGAATLVCQPGQSADLTFNGTNYTTLANTCGLGTASKQNTGTSGATIPLLNGNNTSSGNNTHSGSETFTEVVGGGRTVSGTTDTLAATDCGTTVIYSNAGAVTVTVPQGLPTICTIALLQSGAGKVSTNGSAVTPATQRASGSFTGTRAQWSVINITNYTTNTVVLSGDAS